MPATLRLFGFSLPMYGLCSAAGFLFVGILIFLLIRKKILSSWVTVQLAFWSVLGLWLGAHLLFGLTRLPDFIRWCRQSYDSAELLTQLENTFGGLVFYGGLLGCLAGALLFLRWLRMPPEEAGLYRDATVLCVPLFHLFGRIGCFFAGCCYGEPAEWGMICGTDSVPRVPVQLMEAAAEGIFFLALLVMFFRGLCRGKLIRCYLGAYAVVRFVLEFFRGDAIRGMWGPFSTSQWISLILILSVAGLTVYENRSGRKQATR